MIDPPDDLHSGLPPRISADAAALAPVTLSVARRMSIYADPAGVMWVDHADLARRCEADVAAICAAFEQLARRSHVSVVRGDGRIGYRFVAESPAERKKQGPRIIPFPRQHDRAFVERIAARMARLTRAAAKVYLRRTLHDLAAELRGRGIAEPDIEKEVDRLGAAINAACFAAVLIPDDQEPA
jgi:hypothetical protein